MTNDTLSFSGDICEEGTLTVIIAIVFFFILFLGRLMLHRGTKREQAKKSGLGATRQLTTNHWLEDRLVTPFVPSSLESYVAIIFFVWFVLTIPMGISRFYEGRWTQQLLAQQGPLNLIAHAFGCKGLEFVAIQYPLQAEDKPIGETNDLKYSEDIDWYFTVHLAGGITWLAAGSLQIFLARSGWSKDDIIRRRAHKVFGYCFALPAFFLHITMAFLMARRNPVNQVFIIQVQYFATIFESILLIVLGIGYRRKGGVNAEEMHMVRMFFAFLQSVFGSGAVRLTAWMLWLIAKFFPMEWRILIDRSVCQERAIEDGYQMGSAEHCWKSVFLNLATTDLLIVWLEWIFLCIDFKKIIVKEDQEATITKFKSLISLLTIFILCVAFDVSDTPLMILMFIYAIIVRLHSIRMVIHSFAITPAKKNSSWARAAKILKYFYLVDEREEEDHPHQD